MITLADGAGTVVASVTDADAARASPRLHDFAAQIQQAGEPRVITDARTVPRYAGDGDDSGVALLGAPLLGDDGAAIGSFCVMHSRPRHWAIQDVELVGELTSSAKTELDLLAARAEAVAEKRWSERQQAVLELIAGRAPLARTMRELLHAAQTHAPGMVALITRLEPARGEADRLRVVAAIGLPRRFTSALDGTAVSEGISISGSAAYRREPVIVDDIERAALSPEVVVLATRHGLRAGWSTPILSRGGATLGTFTIYYRTRRSPDARDRAVVDRSVHIARLAIEQAADAETLRRNVTRARSLAREQTALQRVATSVAGATEPETLFSLIAEQVGRLLKAQAGYVLRFEGEDGYRNVGSWTRDDARLLAPDALATHSSDGPLAMLRNSRGAHRYALAAGRDELDFPHRVAANVMVDGRSWGAIVALRDSAGFGRDDEKRLVRFARLASVAVANAQAHETLAMQALTDPLTGLANRRAFDARLAEETDRAHRHGRALSVVLVDVDHFKTINDRFGHATGDRVLVGLADSLREVMRDGDVLARIGGDEAAMILPDCPPGHAAEVAQRMLDASASSSLSRRLGVTLSAGVAGMCAGQTADDLLRCTDQALYVAKSEGRNRVVGYDDDMPYRSGLRLSA